VSESLLGYIEVSSVSTEAHFLTSSWKSVAVLLYLPESSTKPLWKAEILHGLDVLTEDFYGCKGPHSSPPTAVPHEAQTYFCVIFIQMFTIKCSGT
jgi:hypothetical protein